MKLVTLYPVQGTGSNPLLRLQLPKGFYTAHSDGKLTTGSVLWGCTPSDRLPPPSPWSRRLLYSCQVEAFCLYHLKMKQCSAIYCIDNNRQWRGSRLSCIYFWNWLADIKIKQPSWVPDSRIYWIFPVSKKKFTVLPQVEEEHWSAKNLLLRTWACLWIRSQMAFGKVETYATKSVLPDYTTLNFFTLFFSVIYIIVLFGWVPIFITSCRETIKLGYQILIQLEKMQIINLWFTTTMQITPHFFINFFQKLSVFRFWE